MADEPLRHELYTHGHAPAVVRQHAQRTADEAAAFLLPHLRPVVRPGGVVAVREVDWSTVAYWPRDLWIDRFVETHLRTWYRNGGEPQMGRHLRALFNGAGVASLQVTASVWCYATREDTVEWGESYADRLLTSPMGERPIEYGDASRAEIESMAAALRAWGSHPDAFWVFTHVQALGWKAR